MRRAAGFTLIELIFVIVFISVALAGIAAMFANNNQALVLTEDVQKAAQYAQECAERVLTVRRSRGFSSSNLTSTMCTAGNLSDVPAGFTRTVTIGANYPGTNATACPNGATCKDVTVAVTKGSASTSLLIMLASY
jgi:type II secretory pathway pseudopilin PulG